MSTDPAEGAPTLATKLTTERLLLRPPKHGDVGAIRAAYRKNDAVLRPYLPLPPPGVDPTSLTEITAGVLRHRRQWRERAGYTFYLLRRDDPDVIIGRVALVHIIWRPLDMATLGYWLDADQRGQGLAVEAVGAAVEFAFERLALHRVEACIMPRNTPSQRVVNALGFRHEGRAERYLQIAGTWEDHDRYAMTAEDWAARHQSGD